MQVIEPRTPGQGATRASAGILAPYIEGHADIFAISARAASSSTTTSLPACATTAATSPYQRNGTFELAFCEADVERLNDLSATLWKQGIEARWIAPEAFGDIEPLAAGTPAARC